MGSYLESSPVLTAVADYPELCVEWAPLDGPNVGDCWWCDITAYVSEGSTQRGRQYELEQFQAGQCSLTLKSTDRLFDPENTAGPFYPWLIPMRQLRVSAVWNSVRYPIFRGYVTDWGQTVPQDAAFVTTVSASDGFVRLEQIKLPSSAWALEVLKDSPSAWFRLNEVDTVRLTDTSENGNYGLFDNCEQGIEGLIAHDTDGGAGFSHSTEERIVIQNPNLITAYPFTISAMVRIDSLPTNFGVIFSGWPKAPATTSGRLVMGVDSTTAWASGATGHPGALVCDLGDGTNESTMQSSVLIDDDLAHHVVWVASSAGSWALYVDGTSVGQTMVSSPGSAAWLAAQPTNFTIGNYTDLDVGDYGFGTNVGDGNLNDAGLEGKRGTIDEFCVWNGAAVSASRIAAHSFAAKTGWEGDDTGTRVTRLLDTIDWPASLRDIDTGISILGPASWSAGSTALSVIQGWADTEYGHFFVDKSGRVVWHSRHFCYLDPTSTTSQATFGDRYSAATLKYDTDAFDLTREETLIRNPVQAGRDGGITVTVKDTTYVEKYGDRTWAAPVTQDQADATVRDRATWLLARYKELGSRLARMQITPRRDPANLWPQVLGREVGERITVKRTPLGLNAETSVDQILEGIAHQFAPKQWTTTFRGSPVDSGVNTYLILDDVTYGKLDSARLAY